MINKQLFFPAIQYMKRISDQKVLAARMSKALDDVRKYFDNKCDQLVMGEGFNHFRGLLKDSRSNGIITNMSSRICSSKILSQTAR